MQNKGNVVLTMNIGETKIQFCDDYCVSAEESEKIVDRVVAYALRTYMAQEYKKKKAAQGGLGAAE